MEEDMLLRKAEVQYVAEMPPDKRTLDKFEAVTATSYGSLFGRLERHGGRNDPMFRHDGQFCNIEPKICQHD
jgi:hypothetical protein